MAKKGKLSRIAEQSSEKRPVRYRKYQYLFLIVCEDEKTEPTYFEKFQKQIPPESIFLKTVGTGRDAKGVVEQTLLERDELTDISKKEVDVTWAVFDTDDANTNVAKAQRFQEAIEIGEENNLKLAYSNEVFELWLLLHLTPIDGNTPFKRAEVYKLLQEQVRQHEGFGTFEYEHGKEEVLKAVEKIGDENAAIKRAEDLLSHHGQRNPINANPSTKVHLLVKDLLEWIAYFSFEPE